MNDTQDMIVTIIVAIILGPWIYFLVGFYVSWVMDVMNSFKNRIRFYVQERRNKKEFDEYRNR